MRNAVTKSRELCWPRGACCMSRRSTFVFAPMPRHLPDATQRVIAGDTGHDGVQNGGLERDFLVKFDLRGAAVSKLRQDGRRLPAVNAGHLQGGKEGGWGAGKNTAFAFHASLKQGAREKRRVAIRKDTLTLGGSWPARVIAPSTVMLLPPRRSVRSCLCLVRAVASFRAPLSPSLLPVRLAKHMGSTRPSVEAKGKGNHRSK